MSKSSKKVLVNGCGLTFGSEAIRAWPQVLAAVGADIVNLSAPAVSNQWIVDRTAEYLLTHRDIDAAVIQLTSINKLDVEICNNRLQDLIEPDSLRNFTWQGVWPSSVSAEHVSKQLYYEHLYSPMLLTKELAVKLALLNYWCQHSGIELLIYQGYAIPWTADDLDLVSGVIQNLDLPWATEYKSSNHYKNHNFSNSNTVPCQTWFVDRALHISQRLNLEVGQKVLKIQQHYSNR